MFHFEMAMQLRFLVSNDQQRGHSTECINKKQGNSTCQGLPQYN